MDNNIEKPKNFAGQFMPEYQHWHTGQTLMMFQTPPEKNITFPDAEVSFELSQDQFKKTINAANVENVV